MIKPIAVALVAGLSIATTPASRSNEVCATCRDLDNDSMQYGECPPSETYNDSYVHEFYDGGIANYWWSINSHSPVFSVKCYQCGNYHSIRGTCTDGLEEEIEEALDEPVDLAQIMDENRERLLFYAAERKVATVCEGKVSKVIQLPATSMTAEVSAVFGL